MTQKDLINGQIYYASTSYPWLFRFKEIKNGDVYVYSYIDLDYPTDLAGVGDKEESSSILMFHSYNKVEFSYPSKEQLDMYQRLSKFKPDFIPLIFN